jgi:acyl carrier protein
MRRHFLHPGTDPRIASMGRDGIQGPESEVGVPRRLAEEDMAHSIAGRIVMVLTEMNVPTADVTPDTTFESMEIDSLLLEELALLLQKSYGITIETGELVPEQTVAEAAAVLAAKGVAVA